MEIMLGSRRRSENELSVLHWWFRNNHLFPSSSMTFRTQLYCLSLHDNVVILSGLFQHIYHIGFAFNLHSIINNGLIFGGQNSRKRQTVFFCFLTPGTKSRNILKILTWMYHVVHNTWITHGTNTKARHIWLILILGFEKDWHSLRLDRMQSSLKEYFELVVSQKFLDGKLESNQPNQFQTQFLIDQGDLMISILKKWQKFPKFHHGIGRVTSSQSFRNFGIDGEPSEIDGNIFTGFNTLQLR